MYVVGTVIAAASRVRGEAAFLEEGGASFALLGQCASGAPFGMVVDVTHLRARPNNLPRERPFSVGYDTPAPKKWSAVFRWGRLWSSEPLPFCSFPFPRICLVR